jgi:PII-like signaling protein
VNEDCLKLTTYFGERDRAGGAFLADALLDAYERHALQASLLLRGAEGFGIKHHLHTDRQLTLSEDLPVVSVAVDTHERIEAALPEIDRLAGHGLITLERARMVTEPTAAVHLPEELGDATKLTIYVGRQARIAGRPAHLAIVELLREGGLDGASVLLGVDGTAHGERRRARFFGRNADVPMMIIATGAAERIAALLPDLGEMLERPLMTLERVRVCKRDGRRLSEPTHLSEPPSGLALWQKLMIYAGEQTEVDGHPLHSQIVRRLRATGVAGATSLRGVWGFDGGHPPCGDRFWSLRRRVPVVTVVVDTPPNIAAAYEVIDELTAERGLVTSEIVPAFRARGPGIHRGGLELAPRGPG